MSMAKMFPALRAAVSLRPSPAPERFNTTIRAVFLIFLLAAALLSLTRPGFGQDSVSLVGAGSTVPLPLFNKWAQEFNKINHSVQMQYQPLGTSEGIRLISGSKEELGKTDFSAGEILLTEQQRAEGGLMELPAVIIGIVPIYNLPGNPELKFTGDLLAQIILGHVKSWNASQIARLNPGVTLPALPIKVVYRPGGKGTNYVLTDFLSRTSADFRTEIGRSASPKWPVGEPAERSSDMVAKVQGETGSFGYVELQYAVTAHLRFGLVQNAAGKFVKASEKTIVAACRTVETPEWTKFASPLVNAPGEDTFPITSFSWLYLREVSGDVRRRVALVNLLNWIYSSGQTIAAEQGYSPLPPQLLEKIKARVGKLK